MSIVTLGTGMQDGPGRASDCGSRSPAGDAGSYPQGICAPKLQTGGTALSNVNEIKAASLTTPPSAPLNLYDTNTSPDALSPQHQLAIIRPNLLPANICLNGDSSSYIKLRLLGKSGGAFCLGMQNAPKLLMKSQSKALPAQQQSRVLAPRSLPPSPTGLQLAANFASVDSDQDTVSLHVASARLFFGP